MHTWPVSSKPARLLLAVVVVGCTPPAQPTRTADEESALESSAPSDPAELTTSPPGATPTTGAPDEIEPHADDPPDESLPQDDLDELPGSERPAFGADRAHPLDGVSDQQLEQWLLGDRQRLGSLSIGLPNSGRLINGVQLPESPYWERVAPGAAWATHETLEYLTRALAKVHEAFPGSEKLYVGDISVERGGYLTPHLSHQSGRDVDISFFYSKDARWYRRANASNFDRARNWAFVRALISETDVRFILIDRSLHPLLREHAEAIGEDRAWLDSVFRGVGTVRGPIIRHAPGHATHFHVRFDSPIAQETARRCYRLLLKHKMVEPPTYFISHKVKKGETLGKLAKRYGTTIPALKRINGLKSSLIRAGRVYKIPRQGNAAPPPTLLLPRMLPPSKAPLANSGGGGPVSRTLP